MLDENVHLRVVEFAIIIEIILESKSILSDIPQGIHLSSFCKTVDSGLNTSSARSRRFFNGGSVPQITERILLGDTGMVIKRYAT